RRQVVPDQWVELATDAIRDGHTTVDSVVALCHPEVRFTAFRAYMAAMGSFTAKVAMVAPSARRPGQRRRPGSRKLGERLIFRRKAAGIAAIIQSESGRIQGAVF